MNDLKLGRCIVVNNEPYQVVFAQHIKMARGGAVLKTKLKNLLTHNTIEKTWGNSDSVPEADLQHRAANFLYQQEGQYFFMDNADFEQFQFSADEIGVAAKYLAEGQNVDVLVFAGRPVAVSLPAKITMTVASAPEGVKGNSAGAVTKVVTLENNLEIRTPLFIKSGDKIVINTDSGEYVERA